MTVLKGDWIEFNNLETQHLFERFGEVLAEESFCKRATMYSGPINKVWGLKYKSKSKCRVCKNILANRVRAMGKK